MRSEFEEIEEAVVRAKKWWDVRGFLVKAGVFLVILMILSGFGFGVWFNTFVTNVDKHELGFIYNRWNGSITKVSQNGWVVCWPIVNSVHTLDLLPYQVSITASLSATNQRILNAKLVQFDPEGLDTFVMWHGRNAGDNLETLKEILKCYAFDKENGKDCPFLKVLSEVAPSQAATPVKDSANAQ